jgi:hypothetical protein
MSARIYKNADGLVAVNPTGLNFQSDGTAPDTQTLSLTNELQNTEDVAFTITADEPWVDLSLSSGTLSWSVTNTIDVDIDVFESPIPDQEPGTYTAVITISTAFGDTEVPVTLVIAS